MYHTIARRVLESYVRDKKILSIDDLGLSEDPCIERRDLVWVTIYRDGEVVASSGRVALKKANPALELIENTLLCLKDPRFAEYVHSASNLSNLLFRVDMIPPEGRRIVPTADEIEPSRQGIILVSQAYSTISVILPGMSALATRGSDLLHIALIKAGLDPATIAPDDYVLYAVDSKVFSDF